MTGHRTARGREFNMAAFSQANSTVAAIGNVSRNAAGDILGADGEITATAQELQTSYYNRSLNAVRTVSIKEDGTIPPVVSENIPAKTSPTRTAKAAKNEVDSVKEFTDAAGQAKKEVTYADGSIEVIGA